MIDELHVRDIALIEEASIIFGEGLTVLTGETGAGKTALLSALRLVGGQRADSRAVRRGAAEAVAEARLVAEGGEHVIRRRLSAAGRSRCTLDGQIAAVSELAEAAAGIRIHNQHDQVALLQPAAQLDYLDDAVSPDGTHLAPYRQARAAYLEAEKRLADLEEAAAQAAEQSDYLAFMLTQIDEVDPQQGELEELEAELPRLQHAEALVSSASEAAWRINGDGGALDALGEAAAQLTRRAGIDPVLDELAERLDGIADELADAARDIGAYRDSVSHDPHALEAALDRLGELNGLMKRYGPGMERVLERREAARAALDAAGGSSEELESARAACDRAKSDYEKAAAKLSAARASAADAFCARLAESVHGLAMPDARFAYRFEDLSFERWGEGGPQRVELLYSPDGASGLRPLSAIASGGELSRILLALECAHMDAAGADESLTLVFDEVDSGIGGATGQAVAQRLRALAQSVQVVVVTHLPQVAAVADVHYVVEKSVDAHGAATTEVVRVEGDRRVSEVARMLAGMDDATALEHARTLLAEAERSR